MAVEIDFSKPIDISKLKTAEDIKKVQQFLLDQNEPGGPKYNLGTTGDNKNGVDGALGSRTKKAIAQYNEWLAGKNAERAAEQQKRITPVNAINTSATTTPVQTTPEPATATPVEDPNKRVVTISSQPTAQEKKEVQLPSAATPAPAQEKTQVTYYGSSQAPEVQEKIQDEYFEPPLEESKVVSDRNEKNPIDFLDFGQFERHKERVEDIKNVGKTGEEVTTEKTTTENPTATETFDQAMADRSYIQSLFDERRKAAEKERTDQLALASYNSIGNALRSLAQPLGWWGSTANVHPYDNRAYLDAFNSAVAAGNDLRNIDSQEAQFLINRAEYDRRQAEELEQYKARRKADEEYQKQLYGIRGEYLDKQIAGRIQVAEASAQAKYKFKVGNTKATDSVRDSIIKRAGMAYATVVRDYEIARMNGAEGLKEPVSFDEFLKKFASKEGYTLESAETSAGSANATTASGTTTASSASSANPTSKTPPSRQKTTTGADNSKVPPSKRK